MKPEILGPKAFAEVTSSCLVDILAKMLNRRDSDLMAEDGAAICLLRVHSHNMIGRDSSWRRGGGALYSRAPLRARGTQNMPMVLTSLG